MRKWIIILMILIGQWAPFDKDGYSWNYVANDTLVASCTYTGFKIRGREVWIMKYYFQKSDFDYKDKPITEETLSLCECVTRAYDFIVGGYYI